MSIWSSEDVFIPMIFKLEHNKHKEVYLFIQLHIVVLDCSIR